MVSVREGEKKHRPGIEIVGNKDLVEAELTALFIQFRQDPVTKELLDEAFYLSADPVVLAAYHDLIDTFGREKAGEA